MTVEAARQKWETLNDAQVAAHLAVVDVFRETSALSPGQWAHDADGVLLFDWGIPDPRYYKGVHRSVPLIAGEQVIARAQAHFRACNSAGYTVFARRGVDEDLIEAAESAGLTVMTHREPQMMLTQRVDVGGLPPTVSLNGARTTEVVRDFITVASTVFADEHTDQPTLASALDPAYYLLPHNQVVVAYDHGMPVGTGMYRLSHGIGFIYWVAVVESARRQGIGAAMTATLANQCFASGVASVLLHASDQGEPVYRGLGFVEQATYSRYLKVF